MKHRKHCACFALILGVALATDRSVAATLSGTVLHFDGTAIGDAPVRARDLTAGIDLRTRSTADGRYEFSDIPAGTYLITVSMPCCLFLPYANDAVEVAADDTSEHEIQLVAFNVDVEGDDPATVNSDLAARQVIPDEPVPRLSAGVPDLTGVWLVNGDPYPEQPPALEWAEQAFQELAAGNFLAAPGGHCLPGSPPIPAGSSFITGFVQRPELLVMLLEGEPGFRQVFLDGRDHPAKINPTWMGHSIGRWEGDTLVVDTVGYNDRGLVQNYPRTTMLRTEERYTRTSYGELDVVVTYEDPNVFAEPWSQHMTWSLAPQLDIMEYVCENNQWIDTTPADVGLGPQ